MSGDRSAHFDADGHPHMVDVGGKAETARRSVASGRILMQSATLEMIIAGRHAKGDVLGIARIAGIMGAKKTPELVPLCHPLPLTHVHVDLDPDSGANAVHCTGVAETTGRTGVEMEALNAVQIALLTVYDMCKNVDRGMVITDVRLEEKSGGRSGTWQRPRD